jgi:urease accessory protein
MAWHGHLALQYRRADEGGVARTVAHDRHHGPLRVLKPLHPEGPAVCHHVLVHPPGGLVGGDRLEVEVEVGAGAHALITTPGATRLYRSDGLPTAQQVALRLAAGARLEWLPMEAIAYPGCDAANGVALDLAPGAETIGWDLLALGLPASGRPFARGRMRQCIDWPGVWLERGVIDAADAALRLGPAGLAGRSVVGVLWFAAGSPIAPARREALLAAAREGVGAAEGVGAGADAATAVSAADALLVDGATSPDPRLVLLRLLAGRVEPAWQRLRAVRAAWRTLAWGLPPAAPRIWRT